MNYPTNQIRLELTAATNPPVPPIDVVTGNPPRAWRGSTLAIALGIFDANGAAVDLSDVEFLEVDIFPASYFASPPNYNPYTPQPFPPLPPAPLVFVTIPASEITDTVSRDEWLAGAAQQAIATFSWVQMAQLDLDGKQAEDFYLVVHGMTPSGRVIYGAAALPVFESGVQGTYLPNNLAPLVVPAETILYVGPNQQMPFSETIEVAGTVVIDGLLVQY